MSYFLFHLVFLVPPIGLLAALTSGSKRTVAPRYIVLLAAIALAYTTPWDNYLVYRGIWTYGPERVVGTVGYVPVEEYLFFLLQPVLTGLWLRLLLARPSFRVAVTARPLAARRAGAAAGLLVTLVGAACLFE